MEEKEGVGKFFQKMAGSLETKRFFEIGNEVVVLINLAGNFTASGISGENGWIMIWELGPSGKIKRTRITTLPETF